AKKGLQGTYNCILTGLKSIEAPTVTNAVNIVESGKVEEIVGTSGAYELYVIRLTTESDAKKVEVFHTLDYSDFTHSDLENAFSTWLNEYVSLKPLGKHMGSRGASFTGESYQINY